MRKLTFLLVSILLTIGSISAQGNKSFYARFGGNFFLSGSKNSDLFFLPAISFTPGIRIAQSKDFALVLAVPLSVGASFRNNINSYIGVDLPATLELNFGSAAGNNEHSKFGWMLGAGGGYHYAGNYSDNYNDPFSDFRALDFWGYRLHSGFCFGKGSSGDRVMVLLSYGRSFTADNRTVIGAGLFFTMGNVNPLTP